METQINKYSMIEASLSEEYIYMCNVEGCDVQKIKARGYCSKHYSRWRRHRDPLCDRPRGYRHGGVGTKTYKIWEAMRQRCNNPNTKHYDSYGGRGIKTCSRWDDYATFLKDMGEKPEGLSIERRDNDKGYSPDNCYWATQKQQMRNMRRNVYLEHGGRRLCVSEWAEVTGICKETIWRRIKDGWSVSDALTKEPSLTRRSTNVFLEYKGITRTLTEWTRELGMHRKTIQGRLKRGWSVEKALSTQVKRSKR